MKDLKEAEAKWAWSSKEQKIAQTQKNNGELLAEQKSNNSIEEMVTDMMLKGKFSEIARIRNAQTAKSIEQAMEQATKMPTLLDVVDFENAKNNLSNFKNKINETVLKIKEEEEFMQNLKNSTNETAPLDEK